MKLKKVIPAVVAGICMTCSNVCYAEPSEPTDDVLSVLMEEVTTVPETEVAVTTTTTVTEAVSQTVMTTPIVTTPSYYDEILKYVGNENAEHLNDNLGNDALTIDKSTIDYSEKSLYTITTRSGDVFYLIINSSDGSVYFLNSVDTSDLTALLSEDSAKAGNEINQSAIEDMNATEPVTGEEAATTKKESKSTSSSGISRNLIFTVVAIAAVVAVSGIIALVKRKSGSQKSYDDDFFAAAEETVEPVSNIIPYNVEDDFEMATEPEEQNVSAPEMPATAQASETPVYYQDEDDFEENDTY